MHDKLLLAVLLLLNGFMLSWQYPLIANYSSELLRYAKVSQIKAYMDDEQYACDNFYNMACGKWSRPQPATYKNQKTSYLDQLEQLFEQKSIIMLQYDSNTNDNSLDIVLKHYQQSCLSAPSLKDHLQPMLKIVNFYGGWPEIREQFWYENEYDWLKVVAELRLKLGVNILIGLDIVPHFKDEDIQRIKIGAPQLDLLGKSEDEREEYGEYVKNKLHMYLPKMSDSWKEQVAQQVIELEGKLVRGFPANSALTMQQGTRELYVAQIKSAYGDFVDITRYLNIIFNETIYQQIYEWPEDYMSNLVDVISKTPKLQIANYTMWRVLEHFDAVSGHNNNDRGNWCMLQVLNYFPEQLESMFYRNYKNMILINELQSVWSDIKRTFREQLNKLNWIMQETRQRAIQKLDSMDLEILKHDELTFLQQMQYLIIRSDNYFDNLLNVMQWKTKQELAKLHAKPQQAEKRIKLPKYKLTTNKIQIPITFLQSRFFSDDEYPTALKYSTIGFLLAHEMIHGFDNIGRKYERTGYQRNWWDSESEYNYDERTGCFAQQYRNFKFHGKELFDPNALITSIADSGGLTIAYRAYKKWFDNISDESIKAKETLPSLDLKHNQLFFLGFAQLFCADYHESLNTINELPEQLRVNNALSNSIDFNKEFNCNAEAKMNPSKKCKIY